MPVYMLEQAGPHTGGTPGPGWATLTHSQAAKDHFLLCEWVDGWLGEWLGELAEGVVTVGWSAAASR